MKNDLMGTWSFPDPIIYYMIVNWWFLLPVALVITIICFIVYGYVVFRHRKRYPKLLASVAALYIGSYLLLSVNGSYMIANHGGSDWTKSWCPAYLLIEYWKPRPKLLPTPLAVFYGPLLVLDRMIIHPEIDPGI
jgi:hypothetical protein